MGAKLGVYLDVVEYSYPNPDDPKLLRLHKKGFLEEIKRASEDEILDYARLFVVWCEKKLRSCPVWEYEDGVVGVGVPKVRALRSDYYLWIRDLELPRVYYRLVTLTLYRELGFVYSWANINRWVSACLNRVRVKLRRSYGVDILYLWVIEVHKDGFPHVHILFGLSRYVPALTFEVLLRIFQEAWVDDEGRSLCAPQGVDIRYIGRDVQRVKDYILKYLVKEHWKIWAYDVREGVVRVRLSALLIWLFRVRLFGMSQKLKRFERERKRSVAFRGRVPLVVVYRRVGYDVPYEEFRKEFLRRGVLRFENRYLPILLPSVVRRGVGVDGEEEDLYKEVVERF